MRKLATTALLLASFAAAACTEPTDGADETQTEEAAALDPTITPEQQQTDDTPIEGSDENLDAETSE